MPVIRDIRLTLDREQALLGRGMGSGLRRLPKASALLAELLEMVPELLEPSFAYAVLPLDGQSGPQPSPPHGAKVVGITIPVELLSATEIAFVVGTIGPRLEERAVEYFAQKEPLRGVVLDGLGSAAVGLLQQEARKYLQREVGSPGLEISSPIKPGGQCWPLSDQWPIFRLLSPEQIGVSLTSGGVMSPRKSVSMAVGIGAKMPTWTPNEVCARCNMGRGCPYRARAA
ncbi:MAG: hypothetical protein HY687_02935 [Chloroflexi bacterium]|nr:hypothetical protein [Chloroflexota bacterium]